MLEPMYKSSCFAFLGIDEVEEKVKCSALFTQNCKNCKFYKNKNQVESNKKEYCF